MQRRIETICSHIPPSRVFADIGCDHGYCSQYVLRRGLCERAYISDISAGSLEKAKKLLKRYVEEGICVPVVADGLHGIGERCDCVLIAGLGGEEIIRIFEEGYLPERFVLQPMKNAEKVRAYLLGQGCRITADYTFGEGKFYELITGENAGGDEYSDWEIRYGRDNLRAPGPAFLQKLAAEKAKLSAYLGRKNMNAENRAEVRRRLSELEVITDALEDDL